MATLKIDLVDGNAGRYTKSGWEGATRTAVVTGVTGSKTAKLQTAINASGVPEIGDEHPSLENLFVDALVPESIEPTIVRLRIEYTTDPQTEDEPIAGNVSVGTSLSSSPVNVDVSGNELQVSFTLTGDEDDREYQSGIVDGLLPETTITASRKESSSPGTKSKTYVGKVNNSGWSLDPASKSHEWLCTGITGTSDDNEQTWDVTYTFAFREKYLGSSDALLLAMPGWQSVVTWINPETGRPPVDWLDDFNSADRFQIYETIDFDGLNL